MSEYTTILRVLVGSRAYGLERPDSDYDYREVFIHPTRELLALEGASKTENWNLGRGQDETGYELGHFLKLATKSNPSILEVFRGPVEEEHPVYGPELRGLMDKVWTAKGVADAFGGYSYNQRKKFLDDQEGRRWKYAVAYVRVLYQGIALLSEGDFAIPLPSAQTNVLRRIRNQDCGLGEVVEIAENRRELLENRAAIGPFKNHKQDLQAVNEFLLRVRKENW